MMNADEKLGYVVRELWEAAQRRGDGPGPLPIEAPFWAASTRYFFALHPAEVGMNTWNLDGVVRQKLSGVDGMMGEGR